MNVAITKPKPSLKPRFLTLMFMGLLLMSCIKIIDPKDGTTTPTPVAAKVEVQSQCGPFRAQLDAVDVTSQFSSTSPYEANLGNLSIGSHKLEVSADTRDWLMTCGTARATSDFIVRPDTEYMKQCREQDVPIPPDLILNVTPNPKTAWEFLGDLNLVAGSRNVAVPGESAEIYAYSDPVKRGSCIALLRYGDRPQIGFICQSAVKGTSCFWNKNQTPPRAEHPGVHPRVAIETLDDPIGSGTGRGVIPSNDCTRCHRGNNAFILFPDDPLWAKVLRGPLVTKSGSTFTTKVERSADTDDHGRFRHIPIGMLNPKAISGCASGCHERTDVFEDFRLMLGAWANTFPDPPPYPKMDPTPNCGYNCSR